MYVLVLGSKHCIWFMIITHNCNPIITGIENSLFSSIDDYHPDWGSSRMVRYNVALSLGPHSLGPPVSQKITTTHFLSLKKQLYKNVSFIKYPLVA